MFRKSATTFSSTKKAEEKFSPPRLLLDLDETLVSFMSVALPDDANQHSEFIALRRGNLSNLYPDIKVDGIEALELRLERELIHHLPHPAMDTFLKWIFTILKAKVTFYSAGEKLRNESLVPKLMEYTLGQDEYKKINDEERCSVVTVPRPSNSQLWEAKKYIDYALDQTDKLDKEIRNKTILIDNNPAHIGKNERRHMLVAPTLMLDDDNFNDVISLNHIFYITGILLAVMKGKRCPADKLDVMQYGDDDTPDDPKDLYDQLKFYKSGLKELQKIDPKLRFAREIELLEAIDPDIQSKLVCYV